MVVRRTKKSIKHRGTRHCGWGIRGHRGSGNRGGFGNAGSGKRADAKKPTYDRIEDYFGKHGFAPRTRTATKVRTINLSDLEMHISAFVKAGHAKAHGDSVECNLTEAGFTKLLGKGKATKKLKIVVAEASKGAKEAVLAAGGSLSTE